MNSDLKIMSLPDWSTSMMSRMTTMPRVLYDLGAQTCRHFLGYLSEDDTRRILRVYQREIARLIHIQMQDRYWEDTAGYDV
jgi:hypothetical protein